MTSAVKDARYPVGLGQKCRIRHGKPETDAEPLGAAYERSGLGKYNECHKIAHGEPSKQHKAQLSSRRLDDWSVEVTNERDEDDPRKAQTDGRQHRWNDSERTVPAHVLLFKSAAAASIVGRPPSFRAGNARLLADDVLDRVARRADPAAGVALLDALDLTDSTWFTAA